MDNWPKGYSQSVNFLIRFLLVFILGFVYFWAFYLFVPYLGYAGLILEANPTAFIILMIYIQLLFAYIWRKLPINSVMQ
ncbi:MAG: hypothetical protein P1Q69_02975 [Candidatus Thorarchaeota archaeon]|nr:hypothetical protein [Candidatus Thorarchaeota archaeon]